MGTRNLLRRVYAAVFAALAVSALPACAQQQPPLRGDAVVLDAREALRKQDRVRLATARAQAAAEQHSLTPWVEYWELTNRLQEARIDEVEAFYQRWAGTYVEDRLRNDWLLELGRRRAWADFSRDFPRFRMNDDRQVTCYSLVARHLAGEDVADTAKVAWWAQRDVDDGCTLLASTLNQDRKLEQADVWHAARLAAEYNRPRVARFAGELISPTVGAAVAELFDNPARYLSRKATTRGRHSAELTVLALMRMAANDPVAAATQLETRWERTLAPELAAHAWAVIGKQAALKLMPEAPGYSQHAWALVKRKGVVPDWTDDTYAWQVRAALRADRDPTRWQQVLRAIQAMSPAEAREATWIYWQARALQATAREGEEGATQRARAAEMLASIADQYSFYGKLAAEDLGRPIPLPARPAPLTPQERNAAASNPGLARALQLIALGLRNEGVREWNYSLRSMGDRDLLAAAQLACDREVWDRCINTSERTRTEVDMAQRFPTPLRNSVVARAREAGLDPAYVYGLIRQESRFIPDARSHVGAAGLMQLMPATARWTARKLGVAYTPDMIANPDVNLTLGTGYLKMVLDSFDGSMALAAAGYNAGPTRPRRWREGPVLDAAIWAENIPFNETRDYVKRVLSNATYYSAMLNNGQPGSLRERLGRFIGPRETRAPEEVADLP